MDAAQRLEVARIVSEEEEAGRTHEQVFEIVGRMFPGLTWSEMIEILREDAERHQAMAMKLEDEGVALDQLTAWLRRCPHFREGSNTTSGEAVAWLAEHGTEEDKEFARQWQAQEKAGAYREAQIERAAQWSRWTTLNPDESITFHKGHPYGPEDGLDHEVDRLLIDFLCHDMTENWPAGSDFDADPRWNLLWEAWRKTIPPHVRNRIDNAPDDATQERWLQHASEIEPGFPEAMANLIARKYVTEQAGEYFEECIADGSIVPALNPDGTPQLDERGEPLYRMVKPDDTPEPPDAAA